jgi:hypothetical protein
MTTSSNQVYKYAQRGKCRVEYVNKEFHFHGHLPDREPIIVQSKDMLNLCSYALTCKDQYERTKAELVTNPNMPDSCPASFEASRSGNEAIKIEVNTFKGKVTTWLRLYTYSGSAKGACLGCAMFSDADPQLLKDFYYKCVSQ